MTRCVVVGAGAREHAIAHALRDVFDVVVTPGNAGIAAHGIACSDEKPEQLQPDLVVIGPEAPLVAGVADALRAAGIPAVVRSWSHQQEVLVQYLDRKASGLIVPRIESAQEAKAVVETVKYACLDAAERLVILQIESRAGIAQAQAIASTAGSPKPSYRDGNTVTVALAYAAGTSSSARSLCTTRPLIPSSETSRSSSAVRAPPPARKRVMSSSRSATFEKACRRVVPSL